MSLVQGEPEGTVRDVDWWEAEAFNLGLTNPEGGEVVISVKLEGRHIGVTAPPQVAREIAAQLIELAELCEKENDDA